MNAKLSSQTGNQRFVLDTSAILSGIFNLSEGIFLISRGVMDEIALGKASRSLQMNISNLEIFSPKESSISIVKRAAKVTRDLNNLSSTDIELIAIALETNSTLITDDFAMENVAQYLGVKFTGADLEKIGYHIKWGYRCTGCGMRFSDYSESCPVCGHKLRRFAKTYKPIRDDQ